MLSWCQTMYRWFSPLAIEDISLCRYLKQKPNLHNPAAAIPDLWMLDPAGSLGG